MLLEWRAAAEAQMLSLCVQQVQQQLLLAAFAAAVAPSSACTRVICLWYKIPTILYQLLITNTVLISVERLAESTSRTRSFFDKAFWCGWVLLCV